MQIQQNYEILVCNACRTPEKMVFELKVRLLSKQLAVPVVSQVAVVVVAPAPAAAAAAEAVVDGIAQ